MSAESAVQDNDLRERIYLEIVELQRRIQVLHSKRNTLAPISRLSPELLAQIFLLVQDNILYEGLTTSSHQYNEWMCIPHVSQSWRAVAFGFVSLWARIVVMQKHWVQVCLQQSGTAFLTAQLGIYSPNYLSIAQVTFRELHQISNQ
ncbi:hypothetical protein BDN72DRAFT_900464 [Pluteus cervinus]|uniref:Uncharacterized protein n=1 Tax=Pluteus cervinus TaxID=181527 RepID=A0ACD3AIW2_9AGAR|nr:hypothetical protein BDN72DRAFT_900464 [Pluteus cervinus]